MDSETEKLLESNASGIGVFWHSRLLMFARFWEGKGRIRMLISTHRDGLLIAKAISFFGFGTVAGSSNRGSRHATNALRRALKDGGIIGLTPDGPRGPRMKLQQGCSRLSLATDALIVPMAYSVKRGRFLNTWDKFLLPFPFNRGIVLVGKPIYPDEFKGDREAYRLFVEDRLNAITQKADEWCGHDPVEPAVN
jgi:lysophospholipid acyltransferase (LPLAT)-like uncharacterized protein